jgi:hypothetical protein
MLFENKPICEGFKGMSENATYNTRKGGRQMNDIEQENYDIAMKYWREQLSLPKDNGNSPLEFVVSVFPRLVCKSYPDILADQYPELMIKLNPSWMEKHKPNVYLKLKAEEEKA